MERGSAKLFPRQTDKVASPISQSPEKTVRHVATMPAKKTLAKYFQKSIPISVFLKRIQQLIQALKLVARAMLTAPNFKTNTIKILSKRLTATERHVANMGVLYDFFA